jgi:chromosome partitioning protein
MPVIAVINRKGGSGKSTMATHLAAWLANQKIAVMLGDVDRQQSTRAWLKRRPPQLAPIAGWAIDQKNTLKAPAGITHVVLDTPGGLHGLELAKVIMSADTVLMPMCNSLFDRESASVCLQELRTLPRIASGRCRLGIVGMRLDARTKAADVLRNWADAHGVEFLGALRETQVYVRSLDSGFTIFDPHKPVQSTDLAQWEPILSWTLQKPVSTVTTAVAAPTSPTPAMEPRAIAASRASSLMPPQESLVHGSRLTVFAHSPKPANEDHAPVAATPLRAAGSQALPQYLLRQPAA